MKMQDKIVINDYIENDHYQKKIIRTKQNRITL